MSTIGVTSMGTSQGRPDGIPDTKAKDAPVLEEMMQRFSESASYDSDNRSSYIADTEFSASNDQWEENVKVLRGKHRPALTFNRLNGIVKQIIGDYRQSKLAIKVIPSGSGANEDIADIWAGLIRGIEIESNADMVYVNGLECSVRGGFGWFRVLPEYESDDSFNQNLRIRPIHNPLTVYCDTSARLLSRQDARWMGVTEKIPKAELKRLYPKAKLGINGGGFNFELIDDWGDEEQMRIAEYFTKEQKEVRLAAFENGSVVQIDSDDQIKALELIGWKVTKERMSERTMVRWRKCTANEILEERLFKTRYIPLIPVLGEEVNLQGKVALRSTIYYAKDAQRLKNYMQTAAVESVALVSKASWIGTAKHFENLGHIWDKANSMPNARLIYNFDDKAPNGPQRVAPPDQPIGELAMANQNDKEIQYTTGVFDAALGQKSNAISGVAESERQGQSATNTFIPVDNLRKSIEHCGRVIIDWAPEFLDTERTIRTVGIEGDSDFETINKKNYNPLLGVTTVLNDISVGTYDVVIETGPNFASERREAMTNMMKWAQSFPQQAPLVADLILEDIGTPQCEVAAARVKRSLPANITTDPDSPEGQQAAAEAKQQQQQQQQIQTTALQQHQQQEQAKTTAEMSKSQATVVKSQAEVLKARIDAISAISDNQNESQALKISEINDAQRLGQNSQPAQSQAPQTVTAAPTAPAPDTSPILREIAQHLAQTHHINTAQQNKTHELLGNVADTLGKHENALHQIANNQHNGTNAMMANAVATLAKVHAAPTEAVRGKDGKIIGSKKVLT